MDLLTNKGTPVITVTCKDCNAELYVDPHHINLRMVSGLPFLPAYIKGEICCRECGAHVGIPIDKIQDATLGQLVKKQLLKRS